MFFSVGQAYESCNGSNDAFVNLMVNGGEFPYTYLWSPGGGASSFETDLSPGNYSITITDKNNCQTIYQLHITEPLPIAINLQSTPVSCKGLHDGRSEANVTGGSMPYSYLWSPGNLNTSTASNLTAGNYLVRITDDHGCTMTSSSTIEEPPALIVSVATYESHCGKSNGSAVAHVSGGTSNYSYDWSFGGIDSVATNLHSGNYFLTITDANGCTVTDSFTLKDNSPSAVTVSSISPVTCNGWHDGSVVLKANGDGGDVSYSWIPNVSNGLIANNLSSGIYSVIIRDGNRCRDSIGFIVPQPAPLAALMFTENNKCFGASEGIMYADAGGGIQPYTYLWSNGEQSDSAINLPAGNYSLVITDSHGCTSTTLGTITQPDSIHISFDVVNATCSTCVNGSIEAMINGGKPPYSLQWKLLNKDTTFISDLGAGMYTLCVMDGNNCLHCDSAMVNGGNIGVEEIDKSSGLFVYPNPVEKNGVFAFSLNKKQKVSIRLFSSSGQLVKTIVDENLDAGQRAIRFDVSTISPGVYHFQFVSESSFKAGTIVVQR